MLYQTDSGAGVLVLIALQQQQLGSLVLLRVTPASTNDSNNSHLVDKPQNPHWSNGPAAQEPIPERQPVRRSRFIFNDQGGSLKMLLSPCVPYRGAPRSRLYTEEQ